MRNCKVRGDYSLNIFHFQVIHDQFLDSYGILAGVSNQKVLGIFANKNPKSQSGIAFKSTIDPSSSSLTTLELTEARQISIVFTRKCAQAPRYFLF